MENVNKNREIDSSELARFILDEFDAYREKFKFITGEAKQRFERADWAAVQKASTERMALYDGFAKELVAHIRSRFGSEGEPLSGWPSVKEAYFSQLQGRKDFDLAQTIFNTVYRKLFSGQVLDDTNAFVTNPFEAEPRFDISLSRKWGPATDLRQLLQEILSAYPFKTAWRDQERDLDNMIDAMRSSIPLLRSSRSVSFDMLLPVFYRNKGAYLIGKMMIDEHLFPVAIPLLNEGGGLYVDTIIWNESDLSLIFSFTRSYFMVDTEYPFELISYLQELLPQKKRSELYSSIGLFKHGKTEFYRGFIRHLNRSDDTFVIARGIKGMVMSVFTLPSYQVVFKVIKDKFSATKKITRQQVKDRYYLVKTHDRVGRMADTQEFSNFVFPRDRFNPDLIEELQEVAASSIELTDTQVILKHLYTERLMTPLNLYIDGRSDYVLRQALDEYGNAIKQLAVANIFPGDMLLKNFGVTRHGRVVFYDYDEICYLTDVNFRKIPEPRSIEEEMSAEPWYSVGPNDVFPEEFKTFLFNSEKQRQLFEEMHGEIFSVDFWKRAQQEVMDNQVVDVFPYRRKKRFDHIQ